MPDKQCFPFCETFYEYEGRLVCTECNNYKECSDEYWSQVDKHWDQYLEEQLWNEYGKAKAYMNEKELNDRGLNPWKVLDEN